MRRGRRLLVPFAANPIITDIYTAEPAPPVVGNTVCVYAGLPTGVLERTAFQP